MADTHAAAMNFLNALERIPGIIDQYRKKNEVLEREIPQLQEIAGKTWKKEDELKQLKSELVILDRKIKTNLAIKQDEITYQEENANFIRDVSKDLESNNLDIVRTKVHNAFSL